MSEHSESASSSDQSLASERALPSGTPPELSTALAQVLLAGERLRSVLAVRHGLTAVESSALSHLEAAGPLTQRQLGDRVGLSTGAVTGLVDRLERHDVCRRAPHPTDRRSSFVTLTGHGREVLEGLTADLLAAAGVVGGERRGATAGDLQDIAAAMTDQIGTWRFRSATVSLDNAGSRTQRVAAS